MNAPGVPAIHHRVLLGTDLIMSGNMPIRAALATRH